MRNSHTPNVPRFDGQDEFAGDIIHNSELRSRDQLVGRKVLVVGYGKSATDAAVLAADHAETAGIVFREAHWPVPAVLPGGIPFKFALFNRDFRCFPILRVLPFLLNDLVELSQHMFL